ncbi:MAG: hypothetical protein AB7L91_19640 [Dehalococcoidia bacterium]
MTNDHGACRPPDVPVEVWDWIGTHLPHLPPSHAERPLSAVVLAAAHQDKNTAGPTPDDVLLGWSRLIDSSYRAVNQAERVFIEHARAAQWPDDRIRTALSLTPDTDLESRVAELNAMVYRQVRPPTE